MKANTRLKGHLQHHEHADPGDYDEVWDTLKREMRPNLTGAYRVVFAAKFMGPAEKSI